MNIQAKPLSEITHEAVDLLFKEIGIVSTVRFLNQFTIGYGNYTEECEALFKGITLEQVLTSTRLKGGKRNS